MRPFVDSIDKCDIMTRIGEVYKDQVGHVPHHSLGPSYANDDTRSQSVNLIKFCVVIYYIL